MRRLAESGNLDVWYSHVDIEAVIAGLATQASKQKSKVAAQMASKATSIVAKSRTKDSLQAQEKLTEVVGGRRRIISDPPLIVPLAELSAEQEPDALLESLHQLVRSYRRTLQTDRRHLVEEFELIDVARKVVGVGSVGTRAWILLFQGRDGDDPLFLQAKEAEASVLEEFVGKSTYASHGERVVAGQHLMQAASDIFLGWQRVEGFDGVSRDYYLRQLRDWKGSFEIEGARPEGLAAYATVCAQALARAHARSGDRIAIASYLGNSSTFDTALVEFSETYADQNERDYDVLKKAVADGRVRAKTGL
jgi:nitroreductase